MLHSESWQYLRYEFGWIEQLRIKIARVTTDAAGWVSGTNVRNIVRSELRRYPCCRVQRIGLVEIEGRV